MRIEKVKKTCYCIIGPKKDTFSNFRVKRINRPTPEYTCYKWKNVYHLIFDNYEEVDELTQKISPGIPATYAKAELLATYVSTRFFEGKPVFHKYIGVSCDAYQVTEDHKVIYEFVAKDEATAVTDVLPEEQTAWDIQKERDINNKLLNTFFKANLDLLCEKYGLELRTDCQGITSINFKSSAALNKFIVNAVNASIIKELNDLGLSAEAEEDIGERIQTCDGYYTDLLINGIQVEEDKLNELTALQ